MEVLTQVAQFILSLSILIVLHELGHFIPAKLFKTKIEKFYLFFDPWFSLFKIKKGDTEYGIGWLPLGGYVKISGMIDESMDKEQMKLPPQPWEFRSKPAWQRLIVMIGGVTVNVILGILIYAMVLFTWGEQYLAPKNAINGVAVDSVGYRMGLRDGDMILTVDTMHIKNLNKVAGVVLINLAKTVTVERDGQKKTIDVKPENISEMIRSHSQLISPRVPCVIDSVIADLPAMKMGLKRGDRIVSVNNKLTPYYNDVATIINDKKNRYSLATLVFVRGKDTLMKRVPINGNGQVGFMNKPLTQTLVIDSIHYSFAASFPAGIHKAYETFDSYVKQFKVLFTVKGATKEIGGFGAIASAYSTTWDWESFWMFTAFLSIVLAFMNILPIPALDGGHVMFLLYEVITRRKPNEKFMEYAQYAGMFLLLALLLYANGNDVVKFFHKQ